MAEHNLHPGPALVPNIPIYEPTAGTQHRKEPAEQSKTYFRELATGNLDVKAVDEHIEDVGEVGGSLDLQRTRTREFLHGRKLMLAFIGWLLTEFMGGLGGNMLSPALPIVASQFDGLNQLGWVSGAYYMTQVACMLLFGQFLALFNAKWVLVSAIVAFMLGSAISGAAMSIETLIIGRAFAGIGAAGCWVCVQTLVALLVKLEDRPQLLGLFGVQNAVSGTCGPILAGAFANAGQWRWCFLIVVPLGALIIGYNIWALPSLPPFPLEEESEARLQRWFEIIHLQAHIPENHWYKRILLVDIVGYFLCTASLICFILALQWGGSTYAYASLTIIGLFVGFGAIFALFVYWETKAAWPLLPAGVYKNRTVVGSSLLSMFTLMCNLFLAVWLPVVYEAGRGVPSLKAGLLIIAFLLTVVVSQAGQGFVMTKTRNYWWWGLFSPIFLAVGGGLLYTMTPETSSAALIGYQIIYGLGVGFTQNVAFIAVQADNPPKAVPAAIAIVSFTQLFGGMCGPIVGNAILSAGLRKYLPATGISDETIKAVEGSVDAIWALSGETRAKVIGAYIKALANVYLAPIPIAFLIIGSALLIRNVRLDKGLA